MMIKELSKIETTTKTLLEWSCKAWIKIISVVKIKIGLLWPKKTWNSRCYRHRRRWENAGYLWRWTEEIEKACYFVVNMCKWPYFHVFLYSTGTKWDERRGSKNPDNRKRGKHTFLSQWATETESEYGKRNENINEKWIKQYKMINCFILIVLYVVCSLHFM